MELRDRYRGSLLGLAIGDALGTTLEFSQPGSFTPLEEMIGGGPFALKPGEWTDDTSMALCLATSLVERQGFDARDQMERYLRWRNEGYLSSNGMCFDIGGTVSSALHRFEATGEPFAGSTDPHAAGNGSIMRLAPVPLFYASQPQQALEKAADSSRTTHGAKTAIDACRYLSALIVGAVHGMSREVLLSPLYSPIPLSWRQHPLVPEIATVAAGSFKQRQPPEIRGTGYVVASLEAALWAFYHSTSFQQGCLLAVNLGDDADTTGAVYGQLAGAFYGESALPQHWHARLAHRSLIESLADQLFDLSRMAEAKQDVSSQERRETMNRAQATRDSWKRVPMPEQKKQIQVDRTFSEEEYQRLQIGLVPQEMEEKWFLYFEEGWLFFHRSWTGYCIYQVRVEPCGPQGVQSASPYRIAEAWVSRDASTYRYTDDDHERALLLFLIEHLLLGYDVPFPRQ